MLCAFCHHDEKDHAKAPTEVKRLVPRIGRYCQLPLCCCTCFIAPEDDSELLWGDPEVTIVT